MSSSRAMVLERPGAALRLVSRARPEPKAGEILVAVTACGVCRTDLHVVDGDLTEGRLPIVPGHEIIGRVAALGPGVSGHQVGDRVGVPWLGGTCGHCRYCDHGQENLCDTPVFTGYTRDGGYADHVVARGDYAFPLPDGYSDAEAAPLLCAGLIGYRALTFAGAPERLGIYGFGAAAHIIAQVAAARGIAITAFTRPGDLAAQAFALSLGCRAALDSDKPAPELLDAAIVFAPVGRLVPAGLKALRKGGTLVLAGIHMSDIPVMRYELLWGERTIRSVANLTREDARDFLALAGRMRIATHVTTYPLTEANAALADLRAGRLSGAAVLLP